MLEGIELFAGRSVTLERRDALPHMRVTDLSTGRAHEIPFPEPTYSAFPDANREWNATKFRYSYQSLVTPRSVFDHDMQTGEGKLLKQTEVSGGSDPIRDTSERDA